MQHRRAGRIAAAVALVFGLTLAPPASAADPTADDPTATADPEFIDHGSVPLTATTTSGGETALMPDGTYRTWLAVSGLASAGVSAYLAEIDPFTRTVLNKYPLPTADGSWGVSVTEAGDVYVATYVQGDLYYLPWGADEIQNVGAPTENTSFLWEGDVDEEGRLYVGTYDGFTPGGVPPGRLVSWDPATREYRDYGTFGMPYTYVRSVEYYDGQLYVGLGPFTAFYKVDAATGERTEIPLPPGVSDDKYTYQLDKAGDYLYVMFAGGVEPSVGWVYDMRREQWSRKGNLGDYRGQSVTSPDRQQGVYLVREGELTGYNPRTGKFAPTGFAGNVDLGGLGAAKGIERVVDPETGHPMIVGGQPSGQIFQYDLVTGEGTLDRVTGLTGTPTNPRSLAVGPDGRVYAGGYFSGGLVAWKPDAQEWEVYDFPHQIEGMATHNGKLYLGIYPNAEIWEYDPAQPYDYQTNPRKLFELKEHGQERPWTLTSAGDLLAIGTSPKNSEPAGALTLYDPADGTHQTFVGIAGDQEISALTYRDGVVYGGSLGCCPSKEDGRVFALDVATGEKLWETVPIPGEHGVSGLAFDAEGRLFGLTAGIGFELDLDTHEVLRSTQYRAWDWPSTAGFQPRAVNLVLDPTDGYLYGSAVGAVVRIDPDTLENTVARTGVNLFASAGAGPKYFTSGNLFVEGRWPAAQ